MPKLQVIWSHLKILQKQNRNNKTTSSSGHSEVKKDPLFMATIEEMCNTTKVNDSSWLIDSGCTNHMTVDLAYSKIWIKTIYLESELGMKTM